MTISAIGANSANTTGAAAKPGLRQEMSALFKDIQSGNLSGAKSDFNVLSQLLGGQGGASASSGPFSALLSQVGSALSSGDISGAQSALSDFQSQGAGSAQSQAQSAAASTTHKHHHHGTGSQSGVASLIQAIQGGDLGGAQQAYDSLTDGSDGDSTQTTDPTKKNGGGNDIFSQLIASVGQSLANSDITAAQKDLAGFAQSQKVGSAVSVSA